MDRLSNSLVIEKWFSYNKSVIVNDSTSLDYITIITSLESFTSSFFCLSWLHWSCRSSGSASAKLPSSFALFGFCHFDYFVRSLHLRTLPPQGWFRWDRRFADLCLDPLSSCWESWHVGGRPGTIAARTLDGPRGTHRGHRRIPGRRHWHSPLLHGWKSCRSWWFVITGRCPSSWAPLVGRPYDSTPLYLHSPLYSWSSIRDEPVPRRWCS